MKSFQIQAFIFSNDCSIFHRSGLDHANWTFKQACAIFFRLHAWRTAIYVAIFYFSVLLIFLTCSFPRIILSRLYSSGKTWLSHHCPPWVSCIPICLQLSPLGKLRLFSVINQFTLRHFIDHQETDVITKSDHGMQTLHGKKSGRDGGGGARETKAETWGGGGGGARRGWGRGRNKSCDVPPPPPGRACRLSCFVCNDFPMIFHFVLFYSMKVKSVKFKALVSNRLRYFTEAIGKNKLHYR